jgi:Gpi18-like mannosyltransferase
MDFDFCILFLTVLGAPFKSNDYVRHLSDWCRIYSGVPFDEKMRRIMHLREFGTPHGDYTPAYNYFLISFVQFGISPLYGVKYIAFCFSLLMAFAMVKIICFLRGGREFNFVLFFLFLLLPYVLLQYSHWGQCDAIYTAFALLAFYFALKKRTVLAFVFLGLGFAFKLQILLFCPVIGLMILLKDEDGRRYLDWRFCWIVPLMYIVNVIPAFFGENFFKCFETYYVQKGLETRLAGNIGNLPWFFTNDKMGRGTQVNQSILLSFYAITFVALAVITMFVLANYKKNKAFKPCSALRCAVAYSFVMVFFMPHMVDRFYFMCAVLAVILAVTNTRDAYKYFAMAVCMTLFFNMYNALFGMVGVAAFWFGRNSFQWLGAWSACVAFFCLTLVGFRRIYIDMKMNFKVTREQIYLLAAASLYLTGAVFMLVNVFRDTKGSFWAGLGFLVAATAIYVWGYFDGKFIKKMSYSDKEQNKIEHGKQTNTDTAGGTTGGNTADTNKSPRAKK